MNILSKVTLKNLKKNKTRTVVTIIGIILSVSMFTAVTTLISSMQNYLVETVKKTEGSYQAMVEDVKPTVLEKMDTSGDFEGYSSIRNFGYAKVNSENEYKPYLFVGGINKDFTKYLNVNMIKGKMPQKTNEIILPEHLKTNGKVEYQIGSIITLDIGDRKIDDINLNQNEMYNEEEKLINTSKKAFTVVGFYERPAFEEYSAPGYTALTIDDKNSDKPYDVYYTVSNVRKIYSISEKYFKDDNLKYHDDLLRFYGISEFDGFNTVLYGFAVVLIVIIMLGSISLIYNAFSISISERTKQFGLLKSVGATKKQVLRSVLFEALFLCSIGIPLGLLAGIGGIGITLWAVNDLFIQSFYIDNGIDLTLHLSLASILVAAVIGLITVLISAYIPAKRAAKKTAIEAIRQSGDIKIKAKKIKSSKLTYKLFGFSGMLANKNFKRNRKKYRSTVISLTMSIILFISASTFSTYISSSYKQFAEQQDYDISYSMTNDIEIKDTKKLISDSKRMRKLLSNQREVSKSVSVFNALTYGIYANKNDVKNLNKNNYDTKKGFYLSASILFISDDVYKNYLVRNHLDVKEYTDKNNMKALINSSYVNKSYDDETGNKNIGKLDVINKNKVNLDIYMIKKLNGYEYNGYYSTEDSDDDINAYYMKGDKEIKIPIDDAIEKKEVEAPCFDVDGPYGTKAYTYSDTALIMPISFLESFTSKNCFDNTASLLYFSAKDHKAATENMKKILNSDSEQNDGHLYDSKEIQEANMALLIVVNIFTYGFIILISLISIANVFNTISTNIMLRKREFAMLKSIGMTKKSFNKMMNYECLLYGLKSIIYGLPIGIFVSYLLGRIMQEGLSMGYIFPTKAVIIAVVSIFIVVFVTMAYSMRKIKKDSPIETLKNENI